MAQLDMQTIQTLIMLSRTVEEADSVIREKVGLSTTEEKIAFLKGMFGDCRVIDQQPTDSDEFVYSLLLNSIISL